MAYDRRDGAIIVFGGVGSYLDGSETWAWDGNQWSIRTASELSALSRIRVNTAMAYDSARGVTVLFGGSQSPGNLGDTWELPSCAPDSDGDGVPDSEDECDNSNLAETVLIEDCDSGVSNHLFDDGCTMADRIAGCGEQGRRGFKDCVKRLTREWKREGLITAEERRAIRRCAADDNDDDDDGHHGHDDDDDGDHPDSDDDDDGGRSSKSLRRSATDRLGRP